MSGRRFDDITYGTLNLITDRLVLVDFVREDFSQGAQLYVSLPDGERSIEPTGGLFFGPRRTENVPLFALRGLMDYPIEMRIQVNNFVYATQTLDGSLHIEREQWGPKPPCSTTLTPKEFNLVREYLPSETPDFFSVPDSHS